MRAHRPVCSALLALFVGWLAVITAFGQPPPADLVLTHGRFYTLEPDRPWAGAVAISGNRIAAVADDAAGVGAFIGPATRVVDLKGAFALPGFIDCHVHMNSAGALLQDANLLPVADDEGLRRELTRVTALLAPGEWITGGQWGAYEQWQRGAATAAGGRAPRWRPSRQLIDAITARHPVFVASYDRRLYLANAPALQAAGLLDQPVAGMELDDTGRPTGLIEDSSPALAALQRVVRPKSEARRLDETRAVLRRLRECGITEIHDITGDDQMRRYAELERDGELTARIWMRADLARAGEFNERGIRFGTHPVTGRPDTRLRWGAYKGYIDGIMGNHTALFFAPYDDQPANHGAFRHHTSDDPPPFRRGNMEKMQGYLREAARGGFPANVHAIGDRGVALMLDSYERLGRELGRELTGYRVIHCQVVRPEDFPRFRALGVVAEVNPYHLSDDMRWMEERIGAVRCRGAYAFRSLLDSGATLVFGSDWGGSPAADYELHPKYLLHAATNRTTITGAPAGGWFPEQKITMAEALRAYTIDAARAAFDGETRGSLKPGKLADLVVLNLDPLALDPSRILELEVDLTLVDGRIVHRRAGGPFPD